MDQILVLDFGGQYNQLIARRVRSEQVYAEIRPYDKITIEEIQTIGYRGIIFTGGPNSVYKESSPHYTSEILNLGIPILGICYGDQLIAYMEGGAGKCVWSCDFVVQRTMAICDRRHGEGGEC